MGSREGTAAAAVAAVGGGAGVNAGNKPGPILVPVPIPATPNRHGVRTPEAKPGSAAPHTEGPVPMSSAASVAPVPLKPAPWAGVRPGTAVTGPAAPVAASIAAVAASGPTSGGSAAQPPPLPPPPAGAASSAGMPSLIAPASFPPSHYMEDDIASVAQPTEFQFQQQQQQQHDYLLGSTITTTGSGMGSPTAAPATSSVFDPFGTSLLVHPQHHHLSSGPSSVGASQLTTIFPSLSLGPSLLQQQQQQQQQQFVGDPSSPPALSSFSRGLSSDGTNVGAAVFQPSASAAAAGRGAGAGGSSTIGGYVLGPSQRHSIDLGASLLPPQPYSPGAGLGSVGNVSGLGVGVGGFGSASPGGLQPSAGGVGGGEMYDDWGDLQLQLPSDLGEILGDDPPLMMSMAASQQQQPLHLQQQHMQQQEQQGVGMGGLYGSGNTNGGSNGVNGSGLGAPPGWGAF